MLTAVTPRRAEPRSTPLSMPCLQDLFHSSSSRPAAGPSSLPARSTAPAMWSAMKVAVLAVALLLVCVRVESADDNVQATITQVKLASSPLETNSSATAPASITTTTEGSSNTHSAVLSSQKLEAGETAVLVDFTPKELEALSALAPSEDPAEDTALAFEATSPSSSDPAEEPPTPAPSSSVTVASTEPDEPEAEAPGPEAATFSFEDPALGATGEDGHLIPMNITISEDRSQEQYPATDAAALAEDDTAFSYATEDVTTSGSPGNNPTEVGSTGEDGHLIPMNVTVSEDQVPENYPVTDAAAFANDDSASSYTTENVFASGSPGDDPTEVGSAGEDGHLIPMNVTISEDRGSENYPVTDAAAFANDDSASSYTTENVFASGSPGDDPTDVGSTGEDGHLIPMNVTVSEDQGPEYYPVTDAAAFANDDSASSYTTENVFASGSPGDDPTEVGSAGEDGHLIPMNITVSEDQGPEYYPVTDAAAFAKDDSATSYTTENVFASGSPGDHPTDVGSTGEEGHLIPMNITVSEDQGPEYYPVTDAAAFANDDSASSYTTENVFASGSAGDDPTDVSSTGEEGHLIPMNITITENQGLGRYESAAFAEDDSSSSYSNEDVYSSTIPRDESTTEGGHLDTNIALMDVSQRPSGYIDTSTFTGDQVSYSAFAFGPEESTTPEEGKLDGNIGYMTLNEEQPASTILADSAVTSEEPEDFASESISRENIYSIYADRAALARQKARTYRPAPKSTGAAWRKGRCTFYGGMDAAGTMSGACGYGNLYASGYGTLTAALSTTLFKNGLACGACFEVACSGKGKPCKAGSIVVTATNFCPPNPGQSANNGGWCNPPNEHFDLSYPAFLQIAEPSAGVVPLQYRRVPCKKLGGIRFTLNGNCNFNLVTITNVGGSGVVTGAFMKGDKTGWAPMSRNWGANWQCSRNYCGQGISIKIVTSDNKISVSRLAGKEWAFGKTYLGNQIK